MDNVQREARLQSIVTIYIITGLLFMLLPGTFLGVWNLISISHLQQLDSLSAWIQAHGHAQIYGWIGTFILGIGFYSLSKMGNLQSFAVRRAWIAYGFWVAGVALRWFSNITSWHWRVGLPSSAALELAGFLIFFATITRHEHEDRHPRQETKDAWMLVVVGATFGFLAALLSNVVVTCRAALIGSGPAVSQAIDQRLLVLPVWGFLVPTVWGFNARWLTIFLGLRAPNGRHLLAALGVAWTGVLCEICGQPIAAALLLLGGAIMSASALHIFEPAEKAAKIQGVHRSFPLFVRFAYVWLAISSILAIWAAAADSGGGIGGASRHAVTVGFLGTMVFAIGQRILPAFRGARVLFSKQLMFSSLLLLTVGCLLRVGSEIPAYEGFAQAQFFWRILPISAVTELVAVALFATNLIVTFCRPPAHLQTPTPLGSVLRISVQS